MYREVKVVAARLCCEIERGSRWLVTGVDPANPELFSIALEDEILRTLQRVYAGVAVAVTLLENHQAEVSVMLNDTLRLEGTVS